ncbi:Hypothetical protein CINCED_3A020035, partial [Cinara cedri]
MLQSSIKENPVNNFKSPTNNRNLLLLRTDEVSLMRIENKRGENDCLEECQRE